MTALESRPKSLLFTPTALPEVILVEPVVHGDDRGFFLETYHRRKYRAGGIDAEFVQDNHSLSARGTLRGLHAQSPNPQGKLVRCIEGAIYDVAVDIRRGSPTFLRWIGVELTADGFEQLWIPPDFAHGFLVLTERAQVEYKCTAPYSPEDDLAVAWNDPEIGIEWPLERALEDRGEPLLSEKDRAAPAARELGGRLPGDAET